MSNLKNFKLQARKEFQENIKKFENDLKLRELVYKTGDIVELLKKGMITLEGIEGNEGLNYLFSILSSHINEIRIELDSIIDLPVLSNFQEFFRLSYYFESKLRKLLTKNLESNFETNAIFSQVALDIFDKRSIQDVLDTACISLEKGLNNREGRAKVFVEISLKDSEDHSLGDLFKDYIEMKKYAENTSKDKIETRVNIHDLDSFNLIPGLWNSSRNGIVLNGDNLNHISGMFKGKGSVSITAILSEKGEFLGTLNVSSDNPNRYLKEQSSDYLNSFSVLSATAIKNSIDHEESRQDKLTGLLLRGAFENKAVKVIKEAKDERKELSIIFFDLDHFKNTNDTYGHDIGDLVLRELGKLVKGFFRGGDILGRIGGEEFLLILPNTSKEDAVQLADILREKISELIIETSKGNLKTTASFGVTSLIVGDDLKSLHKRSDDCLYKAKKSGRDKVISG